MPLIQTKKAASTDESAGALPTPTLTVFTNEGEATLAGNVIADFLEAATFSDVMESEAAGPFIVLPELSELSEKAPPFKKKEKGDDEEDDEEGEDDDDADEAVLPGEVAAQIVDEDDLLHLFEAYLRHLEESATTIQERAALAVFAPYLDEDEDDITVSEEFRTQIAGYLRDVISEAVVLGEAEDLDERFLSKAARMKLTRIRKKPKSGKKKAENRKRARKRRRDPSIKRGEKKFKRKRKNRIKFLQRESSEGLIELGNGAGIPGLELRVGVNEDAELVFEAEVLEAMVEGGVDLDETWTAKLAESKGGKGKTSIAESTHNPLNQTHQLAEGHGLAGGVLARMGYGRPLNETKTPSGAQLDD